MGKFEWEKDRRRAIGRKAIKNGTALFAGEGGADRPVGGKRKSNSSKPLPMVMTFGKHKGRPLKEIPLDYLSWLVVNVKLQAMMAWAVRLEIESRSKHPSIWPIAGRDYEPSADTSCPFDP